VVSSRVALGVIKKLARVYRDFKSHGSREKFLPGVGDIFGFDFNIDLFIHVFKDLLGLGWSKAQIDLKNTVAEGSVTKLQLGSDGISPGILVVEADFKVNGAF
jgi:hypothetical protein